ncbi:MAG: hypothetical protein JWQ99_1620 [Blastococcus sp.]|nr:hypothetical protein [Blastococcus sp.]
MSHSLRSVVVLGVAVLAALLAAPGSATAAGTRDGYDVSYPQCGTPLPAEHAFAVVGVNGGLSTRTNPCLAEQLTWASESSGAVLSQPKVQLYLNTANPGEVLDQVVTWPRSGATPYGACTGTNSMACSWEYGRQRAQNSVVSFFTPAAQAASVDSQPARYTWWLDVETTNTWQSGSSAALARNRATLEGMTAYLVSRGAKVGLYSTRFQWNQIAGAVSPRSNLAGRNSWLAGSTSLAGATATCRTTPLVPRSRVTISQYVVAGLDHDYSCR